MGAIRQRRDGSRWWAGIAVVVGAALGYTLAVDPVVYSPAQILYPAVWIGSSACALWLVRRQLSCLDRRSLTAGTGYAVGLLWLSGLVGLSTSASGLSIHLALPGWGPTIGYSGAIVSVVFVPFLVVGYGTLGILVATAVTATRKAAAAGLLGVFTCVSCAAPLLAGLLGSASVGSVSASLARVQYPIATGAFLASVGTLVWVTRVRDE